jgi:hypothetical protein
LINKLRNLHFNVFRSVDQDDLGVVSFKEALKIISNFRLSLKPDEIEELKSELDPNSTGMVEFENFSGIGSWIVFASFLKSQVDLKLRGKDEEFLFEANMVLFNHKIHGIMDELVNRLKNTEDQEPKISFE